MFRDCIAKTCKGFTFKQICKDEITTQEENMQLLADLDY